MYTIYVGPMLIRVSHNSAIAQLKHCMQGNVNIHVYISSSKQTVSKYYHQKHLEKKKVNSLVSFKDQIDHTTVYEQHSSFFLPSSHGIAQRTDEIINIFNVKNNKVSESTMSCYHHKHQCALSPWHTSGSSSLQYSRTCSDLSCTCVQSPGPEDHQDQGPSEENISKATPKS